MIVNMRFSFSYSRVDSKVMAPKIQVFISACKHFFPLKCLKAYFLYVVSHLCLLSCFKFFVILDCRMPDQNVKLFGCKSGW